MTGSVVDTKVAVVANGRDTHASRACRLACVEHLTRLVNHGRVFVDTDGDILRAYRKRLHPEGQPGVGDLFYRHVLDNQGNTARVRAVEIGAPRTKRLREAFERGTLSNFDRDDRVFALTAAAAKVPVATAIDSDWHQHHDGLQACGIRIHFVCGRQTEAPPRSIRPRPIPP